MLDLARSRAAADGLEIAYIEGDMAGLKGLSGFDTVIMWYFSFGYGADGGHPKILRAAYNALRRGGVLLFDQYNTHLLAREAYPSLVDRGNTLFIHRPRPELEHGRWGVERIVVTEGAMRRSHFSCRSYTPPELRSMLETAGFQDIRFFGDGREPYTLESRKLVVAARK
jgi:SAM-dependent methyltransferase